MVTNFTREITTDLWIDRWIIYFKLDEYIDRHLQINKCDVCTCCCIDYSVLMYRDEIQPKGVN